MPAPAAPRIAILGFSIECNKFAPPATKAHFLARTYLEGEDIISQRRGHHRRGARADVGRSCCRDNRVSWHGGRPELRNQENLPSHSFQRVMSNSVSRNS